MKKSEMKTILKRAFIDCGKWNISCGKLPDGRGSGKFGQVKRGNTFEVETNDGAPVTIDGVLFQNGQIIRARVKNPGNVSANWIY